VASKPERHRLDQGRPGLGRRPMGAIGG